MTIFLDSNTAEKIEKIRNSRRTDIVELVRDIGENPETFFEGGDWSELDFSQSDLTGVSFTGAILVGVTLMSDQVDKVSKSNPTRFSTSEVRRRAPKRTIDKQSARRSKKRNSARFVLEVAEEMRSEIKVSVSQLAAASNISRDTVYKVLKGIPTQRISCEKVVIGLQKLGAKHVNYDQIREVS